MKLAVCDDQRPVLEQMKGLLDQIKIVKQVHLFSDMETFLNICRDGEFYDVVLMDIEWNREKNGIDVGAELLQISPTTKIIYMTAYGVGYAENVFLKPSNLSGFLMKPVKLELLIRNLEKADAERRRGEEKLVIKYKGSVTAIPFGDILCLENKLHKVTIKTKQKDYDCSENLEHMKERLGAQFLACHKSFVVNMDHILAFEGNQVLLDAGEPVSVSKSRYGESKERYFQYISDKM